MASPSGPSDSALIAETLEGNDTAAFGKLVKRYQSDIRLFLRKLTLGDVLLADDLSQETFIRAYRYLSTFKGKSQFSTWLYRIAYNVFKRDRRRPDLVIFRDDMDTRTSNEHDSHGDRIILKLRLDTAMQELKKDERAAITLSYIQGLTHEEIAQIMGRPLGSVKTMITRGKAKLRKKLEAAEKRDLSWNR